jgi:hypothetical protein
VNFEGDQSKWFTIENYVKHMCDHIRSVLKGKVRKLTIEEFYRNSTDIIRDYVLGPNANPDGSPTKRSGMAFPENGMRVTDVEVLVGKPPRLSSSRSRTARWRLSTSRSRRSSSR